MNPVVFALPGNETMALGLTQSLHAELGKLTVRRFPDSESYVRIESQPAQRPAVLVCTLDRPDDKILPLMFAADAARQLGASRVGLVAPYLAYMRQDRSFLPGEEVSSKYFARLLSSAFDWLVTVDPHLHRYPSLEPLFSIPTSAVHAAPLISQWIARNVVKPLVVGPDSESVQWVEAVARGAGAEWVVLDKVRRGDRDVEITLPETARWRDHTPVVVDDIISTARTMIQTVRGLIQAGLRRPVCIGIHAIFAPDAYRDLVLAGAERVVTCNTVPHVSNTLDVTAVLSEAAGALLSPRNEACDARR